MRLFLLLFITIYGSAHYYFYRKLTTACRLPGGWRYSVAALLAISTLMPIIVRLAERQGHPLLALIMAYPGYLWLAILFLFLVSSACWDLARVFNHLIMVMQRKPRRRSPLAARRQFLVCLGAALLCSLYGIWEAQDIRNERIVVASPKLPRHERLRIVQLSDVHLGILSGPARTDKIIAAAIAAKPDLLVSTGDLIDGNLTHDSAMVHRFRQIKPRLGAFAIPGNHEYYVGYERAAAMMREAGFVVLKGESVNVGSIVVAGADDPTARRSNTFQQLPPLQGGAFTLLLKHQPRISAPPPFDLQLSGHVHKGQIFPFNLITWLKFPIKCGLTTLGDGRQVYVSRGTGTWGPPVRFLAPPEITVIDLVPKTP